MATQLFLFIIIKFSCNLTFWFLPLARSENWTKTNCTRSATTTTKQLFFSPPDETNKKQKHYYILYCIIAECFYKSRLFIIIFIFVCYNITIYDIIVLYYHRGKCRKPTTKILFYFFRIFGGWCSVRPGDGDKPKNKQYIIINTIIKAINTKEKK